jgi:hypothetical protein
VVLKWNFRSFFEWTPLPHSPRDPIQDSRKRENPALIRRLIITGTLALVLVTGTVALIQVRHLQLDPITPPFTFDDEFTGTHLDKAKWNVADIGGSGY